MAVMRGQLAAARSDLAGARADSVKLYEKIRYLQRFSAKHSASDGFQVVQVDSEGVAHPKVSPATSLFLTRGRYVHTNVYRACAGSPIVQPFAQNAFPCRRLRGTTR